MNVPEMTAPLEQLAERMGIVLEFSDARGNRIRASAKTLRKLLQAMGVTAQDDNEVKAALLTLDRAIWCRVLPPVKVLREALEPLCVDITFPPGVGLLSWTLHLESGEEQHGRADFAQLTLVAESTLGPSALERRRLHFGSAVPQGYHRLVLEPGSLSMSLIVTPLDCWLPSLADGERMWGLAAHLYLLKSSRNWGIGDFGDLESLIGMASRAGADVIGLNPLHAMFTDNPEHASPYSPASRLLLNVLNIDVNVLPELQESNDARTLLESSEFSEALQRARATHHVNYERVAQIKSQMLLLLFQQCRTSTDGRRWLAFRAFQEARGSILENSCLFLALREYFAAGQPSRPDWHDWPAEYRDIRSAAVAEFARERGLRIEFFAWLQWVAQNQLEQAQRTAADCGMRIGIYRDMAVGADRAGAETWINPQAVVSGAHVGAPPDIYNPAGQDWGLPPFNPLALYEGGYEHFIQLIRANMCCAGALRIDHAMGLQQLYWIPTGEGPAAGSYVRYPVHDLLGILALESHRNKCMVIGEDLGTVPEEFRRRMSEAQILSYRVLLFEQDVATAQFSSSDRYPVLSIAVSGSHDLPTLRGWWESADIDLKQRLGLLSTEEAARQRCARQRDRVELLEALRRERLLDASIEPDMGTLVRAVHAFLARCRSMLAMVQLDDLADELEPINVPGTGEEYPNWRRRISVDLENLLQRDRFADIATLFAAERAVGASAARRVKRL
jgi:4-alpha-glucanotransferase